MLIATSYYHKMLCDSVEFARVTDAAQIEHVAELARVIWSEHYIPIVGRPQIEYMLENVQSAAAIADQIEQGWEYYLCLCESGDCGYLAILPQPDEGRMLLSKLYVDSQMRGSGVGCRMLAFAEQQCRRRGLGLLWLTVYRGNADSIAWYERRGFVNAGSFIQDIGGGFVMNDFKMEKRIGRRSEDD
jgi:diamine N-acetyltransferase